MTEVVGTTRKQAMQVAVLITGALISFNTTFWFLSDLYFSDADARLSSLTPVRTAFLVLTLVAAAASFLAALAPRLFGHGIPLLLAFAALVGGAEAFAHGLPGVLAMTLLVLGAILPLLAWRSWHHSRAAWAFLVSLLAVFGAVSLFGAPKVRGLLGIGLWTAMILPALQTVAVVALAMLRGEYRERV